MRVRLLVVDPVSRIFRRVESVFFELLKLIMSLIVSEVKVVLRDMMSVQQVLDSTMESRFLHAPRAWADGAETRRRGRSGDGS